MQLQYSVLDVFTGSPYEGNQLAIVHAPANLPEDKQQIIAREFGFSETAFIFPEKITTDVEGGRTFVPIKIWGTHYEIPFAGHPTIGISIYLLYELSGIKIPSQLVLGTKAGPVAVTAKDSSKEASLVVPRDFKIHPKLSLPDLKRQQPGLRSEDFGPASLEPCVVSIVKGMNFILLEVTSLDALAKLQPYPKQLPVPQGHLGEWGEMAYVYAFHIEAEEGEKIKARARMFFGIGQEDPATGSAASALGGWYALERAGSRVKTEISVLQGVEIGRRSDILVTVEKDPSTYAIRKISLQGTATQVMRGELFV